MLGWRVVLMLWKYRVRGPEAGSRPAWSPTCTLDDLVTPYAADAEAAGQLDTGPGWARRWMGAAEYGRSGCDLPGPGAGRSAAIAPVRGSAGVRDSGIVPGCEWARGGTPHGSSLPAPNHSGTTLTCGDR